LFFLTASVSLSEKGICGYAEKYHQRGHEYVIQIHYQCCNARGGKKPDQNRRKTANGGDKGTDYAGLKQCLPFHFVLSIMLENNA
jgi:hypothetical protein